jgi:thiol-disulfide isomerase/thioredoxin
MADWYKAHRDAAAQQKVIGRARELAKAHPDEHVVFRTLTMMSRYGPADERTRREVEKVMREELRGRVAGLSDAELAAREKLRSLVGKPLVLEGRTPGGDAVSTARWKGKVVLVDFWATWCGPCVAELPRVKEAYAKYHDGGLEVLGVSCDFEAAALGEFLRKNPDMPWPQLFEPGEGGAPHPLAERYGVRQIPTLFLIDRRGVLRSVTARDDLEDLVPKLLEERAE